MVMINDEVELVDDAEDVVMIENTAVPADLKNRTFVSEKMAVLTPEDVDFLEAPLTEENEEF